MLKGYVINNNRVLNIENKLNSKDLPIEKLFFDGEVYDAFIFIQNIFKQAKSEIIIIDNYVDSSVLDRLKHKEKCVNVVIYTNPSASKLIGTAVNLFNKQYFNLTINYTTKAHDRFIIIEHNELYH